MKWIRSLTRDSAVVLSDLDDHVDARCTIIRITAALLVGTIAGEPEA
jgi:hypothetical protein